MIIVLNKEKITFIDVSTLKIARIELKYGKMKQQEEGLRVIYNALKEITEATSSDNVIMMVGVATGYANAMQHFNLISSSELEDIVEVIKYAGNWELSKVKDFVSEGGTRSAVINN
ncbi:MAG: hypothetical protein K2K87_12115 [Lachnospiraceae bacterium]|nr:hypothetical protein [Lachnospiraceae bacterium]